MNNNHPLQMIAARQQGILTKGQLASFGPDRWAIWHRVERELLEKVYPGIYRLGGTPRTWEQEVLAACAWAGGPPEKWPKGATPAASYGAAARLHGLERFEKASVEITTSQAAPV